MGHVLEHRTDWECAECGERYDNEIGARECCPVYWYFVDLNERGEIMVDIRDENAEKVFETLQGEIDGYMRHTRDIDGLETYLKKLGVMPEGAKLIKG